MLLMNFFIKQTNTVFNFRSTNTSASITKQRVRHMKGLISFTLFKGSYIIG